MTTLLELTFGITAGMKEPGGVRFQFLLILDLWGISFHAVVVFGLGKNLLFKSALGHCDKCGHANGQTRKNVIETFLIVTHQKTNSSHHLTWPSEPWGGSGGH